MTNKKVPIHPSLKPSSFEFKRRLNQLYYNLYDTKTAILPSVQLRKLGLLYSLYRVLISVFLFLSNYINVLNNQNVFVVIPSRLQHMALLLYCVVSLVLFGLFYVTQRYTRQQLGFGLVLDIFILSLLAITSGTPDLQVTMLYMVVVAASFMLLLPYQGISITLLAVIFVIYQQFFYALVNKFTLNNLDDALLLSLSFLGVGFISWSVSQRLNKVEQIAISHALELNRVNAINQEVISKMSHGVLVVDNQLDIVISNQAAINLLAIDQNCTKGDSNNKSLSLEKNLHHCIGKSLAAKHPDLIEWLLSASKFAQSQFVYKLPKSSYAADLLRLNTTPLQGGSLLVIIEDLRREQSNAQQLKLASLGQLTASIAHEIRNPLAAISQASQLLLEDSMESNHKDDNKELYEMIFNQTKRVNRIIEDVLKLSRQAKPNQTKIDLFKWLKNFVADHFRMHDVFIHTRCRPYIYFDTHQLEQIMINLVDNGLRFSSKSHSHAFVELLIECDQKNVILNVLDNGSGVSPEQLTNLFYPFFTTDNEGTGLGLYLSQAFTEANYARLLYVPEYEKTCFRLLIPKIAS